MSERKLRRKSVVTFSGDDDVVQHIIDAHDTKEKMELKCSYCKTPFCSHNGVVRHCIAVHEDEKVSYIATYALQRKYNIEKRKGRRQSFPQRRTSKIQEEPEGESDEENIPLGKSEALEDENNVVGGEVYGFKTPKKSGQMAQIASESRTPKSILKPTSTKDGTPSKSVNFTPSKEEKATPQKRALRKRKPAATTPYRLHKRHATGDSDSSDSLESSDSDSDVEEKPVSAPTTPSSRGSSAPNTPSRRARRKTVEMDMPSGVEEYFDIHAIGAGPTSDTTLSKLDIPRMDQQTLNEVLASVPSSHVKECQQLYMEHRDCFRDWMYQMCNGFNILLFGLGSKRNLIEDFRTSVLKDFSHLVINGYFPSLTVKHILNSITEDILDHTGSFKGPLDQCEFIKKEFDNLGCDFYLIVHSIDGAMLRNEKAQAVLSLLSQVPCLHIVASVDHINSSLVWDQSKCSRFNWLWYDMTTYTGYIEETAYENSLLVQQTGGLALSSLTHVMKSLTPNAKGIFLLLAKYQLENKDNSNYIGMSLQDLYQRCRESFLVNSDLTLQAQLTEFRDHKMIRSKKSYDGVEHLMIPLDTGTLTEFIEQSGDD